MSTKPELGIIDIDKDLYVYLYRDRHYEIAKWLLTLYTDKKLKKIDYSLKNSITAEHLLVKQELENRKKSRINLILYLFEKKFKLLDIRAIALIWKY